jgi:hypothetical protein
VNTEKKDERPEQRQGEKPAEKKAGPEQMTPTERMASGDYARLDAQREMLPIAARGDGLPSSVVNPAFYPKSLKPEALHTEAEKAGSEWPGTKADKQAFDDANEEVAGPSRALPPARDE